MPKSSLPVESHKFSCSTKKTGPSFSSSQVNFFRSWAIVSGITLFWIWVELTNFKAEHKNTSILQAIFSDQKLRQTIFVASSIELTLYLVLVSWFWSDFKELLILLWSYFMEQKLQKIIRSPQNGGVGRLLVFEGTDGVGKTTQLWKLYHHLEEQGYRILFTRWNQNKARKYEAKYFHRTMTPEELNEMEHSGFFAQMDAVILPALESGCIVLSDRYYYTALARDQTRGIPLTKLKQQYQGVPQPDLVFYFDLPVEQTKQRIFHRSDEREAQAGELSDDEKEKSAGTPIGFYEAGLDLKLSDDPVVNFTIFQNRVRSRYHEMKNHFGFKMIDASQSIETQHNLLLEYVHGVLQPPHQLKRTLRIDTALLVLVMLLSFMVPLAVGIVM